MPRRAKHGADSLLDRKKNEEKKQEQNNGAVASRDGLLLEYERAKMNSIKKFTGEGGYTWRQFIKEAKEILTNLGEEDQIRIIKSFFGGKALEKAKMLWDFTKYETLASFEEDMNLLFSVGKTEKAVKLFNVRQLPGEGGTDFVRRYLQALGEWGDPSSTEETNFSDLITRVQPNHRRWLLQLPVEQRKIKFIIGWLEKKEAEFEELEGVRSIENRPQASVSPAYLSQTTQLDLPNLAKQIAAILRPEVTPPAIPPTPGPTPVLCTYCKQNTHEVDNCRIFAAMLKEKKNFRPNFRYEKRKFECNACGKRNHYARECRVKPCVYCRGDHETRTCFKKPFCTFCKKQGHKNIECRRKRPRVQESNNRDKNKICFLCQQVGHISTNCDKKRRVGAHFVVPATPSAETPEQLTEFGPSLKAQYE